jgi:hypothetical protein
MMRKDFQEVERSKFKKSEKMMRKDVSGGGEAQVQKIQKNDEKRRFRRSKFKKSEKVMRKDFQKVEKPKFKKSEKMMRKGFQKVEKPKFKKSEKMMGKDVSGGQNSKNPKK